MGGVFFFSNSNKTEQGPIRRSVDPVTTPALQLGSWRLSELCDLEYLEYLVPHFVRGGTLNHLTDMKRLLKINVDELATFLLSRYFDFVSTKNPVAREMRSII